MIKVSAVNPVTGQGYAYLPFKIVQIKSGAFESDYKTVYEGELGENGKDAFDFRVKSGRQYRVTTNNINSNGSLPCYINNSSYTFTQPDEKKEFNFEYAPCAYLKFRYKNISCQGPNDHIKVYRYTNLEDYVGFIVDAEYDGCTDYTMPNFVDVPMGWWYFEWEVTKNNVTENFTDSIFLSSGEYREYTFEY
jgi:hypothetical protein